jgi:hypothetical protein
MPHYRFKLGQTVVAHAPGVPGVPVGPYVIIRLLPLVRNDPHYQGKSEEGTIRALVESQIRTARPGAPDRSLVLADG